MAIPKIQPVQSPENLIERVDRLFRESAKIQGDVNQLSLDLSLKTENENILNTPRQSLREFLDFATDAVPDGDVYLFGGVLRDLALLGRRGFNSDIDLVVEGDWSNLVSYLRSLGAHKNKFGGYRLQLGGWPVDIWNAKETWAIKQGLVSYRGVSSLVDTTVLNWDAILMNWRTQQLVCRESYFDHINLRVLDIVLEENPNPLGMAIRVFRHFCMKDAKKITPSAARYLANCAKSYNYNEIKKAELKSYKNTVIDRPVHRFFERLDPSKDNDIHHQFSLAGNIVEQELRLT